MLISPTPSFNLLVEWCNYIRVGPTRGWYDVDEKYPHHTPPPPITFDGRFPHATGGWKYLSGGCVISLWGYDDLALSLCINDSRYEGCNSLNLPGRLHGSREPQCFTRLHVIFFSPVSCYRSIVGGGIFKKLNIVFICGYFFSPNFLVWNIHCYIFTLVGLVPFTF